MNPSPVTTPPAIGEPYRNAASLRAAHAHLLGLVEHQLGADATREDEAAAVLAHAGAIEEFLARGQPAGVFIEDMEQRTACQVLLDYWRAALADRGTVGPRVALAEFKLELLDLECPFVGPGALHEGHVLYGRGKVADKLHERIDATPLVVLQGGAGSGKTSLLMAGALPLLTAAGHQPRYQRVGPFRPGADPLLALASALVAAGVASAGSTAAAAAALHADPARLPALLGPADGPAALLLVDQAEELLTLCDEAQRAALGTALAALLQARPAHRVVLLLREEFSAQLARIEALRPWLGPDARFSMNEHPMGYDDLKAACEEPAAAVNLHFHAGVVDDMVKQVLGRSTALPLLQFALSQLWQHREHNLITQKSYDAIQRSPLAAVQAFGDSFYASKDCKPVRDAVEFILRKLVHIGEMMDAQRQPVPRARLLAEGPAGTEQALALLSERGIVGNIAVEGDAQALIELRLEVLMRHWPTYEGWVRDKRERVRRHIALTEAAERWDAERRKGSAGTPEATLLSAGQHADALRLQHPSPLEAAYVAASGAALQRAEREALEAVRSEAVRRERRKRLAWVAALVFVGLVMAGVYDGIRERQLELHQRLLTDMAQAQLAAVTGHHHQAFDKLLSTAREVERLAGDASARPLQHELRKTLLAVLARADDVQRLYMLDKGLFQALVFHPKREDGLMAYAGSGGQTYLASLKTPFAQPLKTCSGNFVMSLAFDPQGRWLAAGCADGTLVLWSTADWKERGRRQLPARALWALAFVGDGAVLAAGGTEGLRLLPVGAEGTLAEPLPLPPTEDAPAGGVWSLAVSPSGHQLLAGDGAGGVWKCAVSGTAVQPCQRAAAYSPDKQDAIRALAFDADGRRVAVGRWKGFVEVLDAQLSLESRISIDVSQVPGPAYSLAFFDDCGRRALAVGKGTALLYRPLGPELPTNAQRCLDVMTASTGDEVHAIGAHGGMLAAATRGGYVAVLDPRRGTGQLLSTAPTTTDALHQQLRGAVVGEQADSTVVAVQADPPSSGQVALHAVRAGGLVDAARPRLIPVAGGVVQRIAASPRQRRMATLAAPAEATAAVTVVITDFDEGFLQPVEKLRIGPADLDGRTPTHLALSPDGRWLALAFKEGAGLLLVAVDDAGRRRVVPTLLAPVLVVAFSPSGGHLVAGGELPGETRTPGALQAWRVGAEGLTPMPYAPLRLGPLTRLVYDVGFFVDDKDTPLVLAGSDDGEVAVWDLETGRSREALHAGSRNLNLLAYSPAAGLLAGIDRYGDTWLWDTRAASQTRLGVPRALPQVPGFIAFGADGSWLATGAHTLQVWDLDERLLLAKACALLRQPGVEGQRWHAEDECRPR